MRLVLIGFGVVGQGLAKLLLEKREELTRDHGLPWRVVGIAGSRKGSCFHPEGIDLAEALAQVERGQSLSDLEQGGGTWSALELLQRAEADVMVEATVTDIATGEPATSHVRAALGRGMHVVTVNKGPVALYLDELQELARSRGRRLLFEGTVMSGTPLLNLVRECLAGSRIEAVEGILNGTCNFVLTRMGEGLPYQAALAEAQRLGYAEALPDADVKGWDTAAKAAILASVAFGARLHPGAIPCEGITGITPENVAEAAGAGQRYKLLGRVWREGGSVRAEVAPRKLPTEHPLAAVGGAANAVAILTDTLGTVTVTGPGAGGRETGFAVLNDLISLARSARP